MNKNHYVAIMAGGVGSRFWPVSKSTYPKQFLDILNTGRSFLQATYDRFAKFTPVENIYIVTSEEYVSLVESQLPQLAKGNILGEPERKNTAPCIAYVSHKVHAENPEANMIIAPSDHLIKNEEAFEKNCLQALSYTDQGDSFVTFGIKPSYANTGYGYIETREANGENISKVNRFTEKPDLETAISFVKKNNYFWNSGIFVWKTESIISAFAEHNPSINSLFESIQETYNTDQENTALKEIYCQCESISIDYAILEKANNVFMIEAEFDWSDLGTWNSAWENFTKNEQKNAVSGKETVVLDSHNCIVHSNDKKLVLVGGVDNLIVVNTPEALLICSKDKEQDIKSYINQIKGTVSETYF
ncbi:mannose-1-phosphate guanylyltransferase [Jiulongibacter sediminis]|uniref:mannose-1-phosphate guanylyltransferase n=1 Tax=Jiulongibacter sediminis TaxID=1605367 RepID=A0A0P7BQ34_9BACT|nr:mannose-1-phosphate guanylyltransferase [Jiulongibacter sediminis]KPM47311.1 mannose-1-phosphate guanylyltransferase [Jiulongibacter sediminis]TBX22869.1 mannose-1-phosphate guanylyltransferase [Jiulongibacter sediminis]